MENHSTIRQFLADVRRKWRRERARTSLFWALSGVLASAAICGAVAFVFTRGTSAWFLVVSVAACLAILGAIIYRGYLVPVRSVASDTAVARLVGLQTPVIASDLLSAVQLGQETSVNEFDSSPVEMDEMDSTGLAPGSVSLVNALKADVAAKVAALPPEAYATCTHRKSARRILGTVLAVYACTVVFAPSAFAEVWRRLSGQVDQGPFAGATLRDQPLVGDLQLRLDYPAYAKLPPTELTSASGSFEALAGTEVTLRATSMRAFSRAQLVLGDDHYLDATSEGGRALTAKFTVGEHSEYRFLLVQDGEHNIEAEARQITIAEDQAPTVSLYTPGDSLEVSELKRVELAYVLEDDFGLASLALVVQRAGEAIDKAQRIPISLDGAARKAQGKFLWDLAELALKPGERVQYFLEAVDNDNIRGPNIGRSRGFSLYIFSPLERHEALIDRQEKLFEEFARLLGGRLTLTDDDIAGHRRLHGRTNTAIASLDTLLDDLGADRLAGPDLVRALEDIAANNRATAANEGRILASGAGPKTLARRLAATDKQIIKHQENDVLSLADWVDRERLEVVLAMTDEIRAHRDRIAELFEQLNADPSDAVRAELDRELNALRRKLARLQSKRRKLTDDVIDRFVNTEALNAAAKAPGCMAQVQKLLNEGKTKEAADKMAECGQDLDDGAKMMESALADMRGANFPESQQNLDQATAELDALRKEQGDIAGNTSKLFDNYAKRADELAKDKARELRRELKRPLKQLSERLESLPKDGLTQFSKDELTSVKRRIQDVKDRLKDGDIAESLAMAKEAAERLDVAAQELQAALDESPRAGWRERTKAAQKAVTRAKDNADDIVKRLRDATPSPGQIMSPKDRGKLAELGRRQARVRERTKKLRDKAKRDKAKLPGRAGQVMEDSLKEALEPMDTSAERMRANDPSGARQASRLAADKLRQAGQDARKGARQHAAPGKDYEPVRIPGTEEYRVPRRFREDVLDAMKKGGGPGRYVDQIKRYYEELTQ